MRFSPTSPLPKEVRELYKLPLDSEQIYTLERAWAKTEVTKELGCFEFKGASSRGYGYIIHAGSNRQVHILSFEFLSGHKTGRQGNGLYVLHTCDNTICWNPAHLYEGSQLQNMDDMIKKGHSTYGRIGLQGSTNGSSKLTEVQVREIKSMPNITFKGERALALRFNVHLTTIHDIITGKAWSHIQ